jgi:hypothetical protein
MPNDDLSKLPVDEVIEKVGVAQAIGIKMVASLLFTYRCTIACKHCLFNCSPNLPDVCTSVEDGVKFMKQLRNTDRVIHIAGGEAMMYYRKMMQICRIANEGGFAPHFIETNASWCISEKIAEKRYKELIQVGVKGILISADPYHQVFVDPDRRYRAFVWAVELFGRENVAAGDISLEALSDLRDIGLNESRLAEYAKDHPPNLVGRAGEALAKYFAERSIDELKDDRLWHSNNSSKGCELEFDPDRMWEIHIDPYGNIQTCCGIIIGNAHKKPLTEYMKTGFIEDNELVKIAYEKGPYGYLDLAVKKGYKQKERYPQKCNLCWETRKFLRQYYPETFGPAEIYDY